MSTNSKHSRTPRIGITLGDPNGIGPEVALKAVESLLQTREFEPIFFGTRDALLATPTFPFELVECAPAAFKLELGKPTMASGQTAAKSIETAVHWALTHKIDALVTAPISKTAMQLANAPAFDHTTYLKQLTESPVVRMAFHSPTLNVVLDSVHVPLREAVTSLSHDHLLETGLHAIAFGKQLGIASPRIAIAGLNPHAGEQGLMGDEEGQILGPVLRDLALKGIQIEGPFPPDTIFRQAHLGQWDVVIALYHDQGLIPVKLLHFDSAVNITLGLPFVRTSPDHGTAYDLAGKNTANATSMLTAISLCLNSLPSRA